MARKPDEPRLTRRDVRRGMWMLIAMAYRSAPGLAVASAVLVPLTSVQMQVRAVWMKLVADAVFRHDVNASIVAACLLAATSGAATLAMMGGAKLRLTLTERAGFAIDRRLAELTVGLPGVEHLERADYLDRLELLRQQRGLLGQGVNLALSYLGTLVQLAVTVLLLVRLSPWMLLLALTGVPALWMTPRQQRRTREVEERMAPTDRLRQAVYELATAPGPGKEVRVNRLAADLIGRHAVAWSDAHVARRRVQLRNSVDMAVTTALPTIGVYASVALVGLRAARGTNTPGDVLLAMSLAGQLTSVVGQMVNMVMSFQQTLRTAGRLLWLADYDAEVRGAQPSPLPMPSAVRDGIRLDGVTFRYPATETDVLRGIDLHLPAGSVVALVGDNGSGKTTLVKLLCRFYEPTAGSITVDGLPLARLPHAEWRGAVAAGFQDFCRFELLVRETVGVGDLPRVDDPAAVAAGLERAGAATLSSEIDGGLTAQLGRQWENGVELSGGQWQKLALGRALMRDEPLLLVLDEPTSALDAETEHALFERFATASRRATNGAVTLIVSHRFSTVRMADIIVVLDHGQVIETGSHAELVRSGGVYAELFELQARNYR